MGTDRWGKECCKKLHHHQKADFRFFDSDRWTEEKNQKQGRCHHACRCLQRYQRCLQCRSCQNVFQRKSSCRLKRLCQRRDRGKEQRSSGCDEVLAGRDSIIRYLFRFPCSGAKWNCRLSFLMFWSRQILLTRNTIGAIFTFQDQLAWKKAHLWAKVFSWWPGRGLNPWMHPWKGCELTTSPPGRRKWRQL